MNIENSVLDYIRYKQKTGMATCKECMTKDSLEKFWSDVHLEDEEREDFEIRGCRRLQQE